MQRDAARLTARTHDVLVVGGGIYGLAIAYDAAARGLSVALVERDDFGSGSSFNHLRTIHGGLRYLQTMDVRRARESIRERRTIARIAPHAVRPLAFVLPLTRSLTKGKLAMRAGFLLDRVLAFDRNAGLPPTHVLPPGRVISREAAIQAYPGLRRRNLTGAAVWYDYETLEPDRLTLAFGIAAEARGAVLMNYVEAVAPLVDQRRVVGVRARDRVADRDVDIAARLTINATGSAVDRLLTPLGLTARVPLLKAMNLVTRRPAGDEALGGRAMSGRHLFLVPWRGRALFGTWESDRTVQPDAAAVSEADVLAFVRELNEAFPSLDLTLDDVTLVHRGIVPAAVDGRGRVALEGHEQLRDHASEGVDGLVSVAGTKYTTARAVAERVVTRALDTLGRPPVPCTTATTALPGGDVADVTAALVEARRGYDASLPSDTLPHLLAAYGSGYEEVLAAAGTRGELLTRLAEDSPVIGAEIAWAARHEAVVRLGDAVIRRTPLGALGYPGEAAVARAAAIVAAELGWPADRVREGIADVRAFYAVTESGTR